MTFETFYLVCFLLGFLLTFVSFLAGATHFHLPHWLSGGGHGHFGGHGHVHGPSTGTKASQASPFNFGTIAAFLAWFGGTGYLLTRYSSLWSLIALGIAAASGLAGAALVFWFLFRVLLAHDRDLDPADYDMIGVLGTVTSSIREAGTGEMIFSQAGTRRAACARSEDGRSIPRGTEVVVTRFESGIAYVRPWEEMSTAVGRTH